MKMTCVICGKLHDRNKSSFVSIISSNKIGRTDEHIHHLCPACANKVHAYIRELRSKCGQEGDI